MPDKEQNAGDVIEAYRRRRGRLIPMLMGGGAVVLLVVGLFLVVMWITGKNPPQLPSFFASSTPTPTETATPMPPTDTPQPTPSPTITDTPTPSGPISYKVQEGDTLYSIAQKFGIQLDVLLAFNPAVADAGTIQVGQDITVPPPSAEVPTPTALPTNLVPGTRIDYVIRSGDTLQTIASQFNSTAEAIASLNKITNPNDIKIGQKIQVPVNIATPTPTLPPSPTPGPGTGTPGTLTSTPPVTTPTP